MIRLGYSTEIIMPIHFQEGLRWPLVNQSSCDPFLEGVIGPFIFVNCPYYVYVPRLSMSMDICIELQLSSGYQ